MPNKYVIEEKNFLMYFIKLATPIAFQHLLITSMGIVDSAMIAGLGEKQISSIAVANQLYLIFYCIFFGFTSGSAIFISQYHGKKDYQGIRNVISVNFVISIAVASLFTLIAFLFHDFLIRLYKITDIETYTYAKEYLLIVALSFIPNVIIFIFSFSLKSVAEPRLPLVLSLISLFVNILFNYLLIYGNLGFPRLEMKGAAIASVFSRIVEVCILIFIIYSKKHFICIKLNDIKKVTLKFVSEYFKTVAPVLGNELFWSSGIFFTNVIFFRMSVFANVSRNICSNIEALILVLVFGAGHAASVIIGQEIGRKNIDGVHLSVKRFFKISIALGFILGIVYYLSIPLIFYVYNSIDQTTRDYIQIMVIISSIITPLKSYNYMHFIGILRSGGDTKFGMIIDMIGVWGITLPLTFLAADVFLFPVAVVYSANIVTEVFITILLHWRIKSNKWINDLVN